MFISHPKITVLCGKLPHVFCEFFVGHIPYSACDKMIIHLCISPHQNYLVTCALRFIYRIISLSRLNNCSKIGILAWHVTYSCCRVRSALERTMFISHPKITVLCGKLPHVFCEFFVGHIPYSACDKMIIHLCISPHQNYLVTCALNFIYRITSMSHLNNCSTIGILARHVTYSCRMVRSSCLPPEGR